jgi:signal transduction histidine kinase/CheY-like chemotaxis protein
MDVFLFVQTSRSALRDRPAASARSAIPVLERLGEKPRPRWMMDRQLNLPASNKFHYALISAAVLVPLIILVVASWENRRELFREAQTTVVQTTSILDQHAKMVFETNELLLAQLNQHLIGKSWSEIDSPDTNRYLHALRGNREQTVSIWVTDANGVVRAGSEPFPKGISHADRDFFTVHRNGDIGTYVGTRFIGRATHKPSFAISRRRATDDGHFDGIVHAAVSPEYFIRFFKNTSPDIRHIAILMRSDGQFLACDPPTGDRPRRDALRKALSDAVAEEPQGGVLWDHSSSDGKVRLVAYQKVEGYPLYVAFGIDTHAVIARWLEHVLVYGLVAVFAAAVLLFFSLRALRDAKAARTAIGSLYAEMDQRQRAENRLHHAQKMEAIGQLTGGIAHDFNNLLQVILGGALALRKGAVDKTASRLDLIIHASRRGAALTKQLLSFARRQRLNPTAIDLGETLKEMSDIVVRTLRGDIEFKMSVAPDLWAVEIDASELEIALINVGANARDAMPSGGTFTLTARNVRLRGSDNPEGLAGDFVELAMRDTGVGMPDSVRARIFEPFFTTKEPDRGTGLGLSQVYGFVSQSGGSVRVESTVGGGTEIILYLPRTEKAPVERISDDDSPRSLDPGSGRILLVDDNVEVAAIGAAMLKELGYHVDVLHDPHVALQKLNAARDHYDILLSDIIMPGGMSGLDLAEAVRRQHPGLPILLMTGYSHAASAARESAFVIVQKPYEASALQTAIGKAKARTPMVA